jgi:cellulose synthase/poly-beta-1,6-N-acetylglucosamine synthase-like glycosyltransferase
VGKAVGLTATTAPASTAYHLRGEVVLAAMGVSTSFVRLLNWLFVGVGILVVVRVGLMVLAARRHRRRRADPRFFWGPPVTAPVSVVVPAYTERECIADTLGSLLTGDHPIEIVVVDDGSTDGTADIAAAVRDPRVRVIRQPNAGKAAALNTGIVHARHELIVMMDGDTVFEPDTVRRLVQPFADRRVGAFAGTAKIVNRRGLIARGSTWSTWSGSRSA